MDADEEAVKYNGSNDGSAVDEKLSPYSSST